MKQSINVLSLFDGMSCGQIALRELGVKVNRYYASEIDKFAIAQTQLNFPDTIQLGDVTKVSAKNLPKIDLLIGGSPCQGFSFAGKQLNFNDPRSKLFFEFVRILKECREINPDVKFMLENVRMKREYEQVISETLGVKPVMINSALVSAQNRVRLYWSNIRTAPDGLFEVKTDIPQPEDKGLCGYDILGTCHLQRRQRRIIQINESKESGGKEPYQQNRIYKPCGLLPALSAGHGGHAPKIQLPNGGVRRLTLNECAELQTIPNWYKWGCSRVQSNIMLGNGWTVDVIKHIFSYLPTINEIAV